VERDHRAGLTFEEGDVIEDFSVVCAIDFDGCLWLVGILAWGDDR